MASAVNDGGKRARPHGQFEAIALSAGVVAGLFAFVGGEFGQEVFRPRLFLVEGPEMISMQPTLESRNAADLKNAAVQFAILGSATALAMGFAGGLLARSVRRGVMVGLGAQAAGSLVGSVTALSFLPSFERRLIPGANNFLGPFLIHAAILAMIGGTSGLAFAIGMGRKRYFLTTTIAAASLGAVLASAIVRLCDVVLSAGSDHVDLVAGSSIVRLLAMFVPSVLIAAGAVAAGAPGDEPSRPRN